MLIFPAIDIKDGSCVRLYQGDFDTAEKVAYDPLETALSFQADGAEWIHMVDLDGARHGTRMNADIYVTVARETGLKVEVGGGIRTMQDVDFYVRGGISRVILGSAAVKNPRLVREAVKEFGSRIAVGIDARDGYVAAEGWVEASSVHYLELAKRMEDAGVSNLIYTDISRAGTLSGPSTDQLLELDAAVSCDITASGGIRSLEHITALRDAGLYAAICGKSIYQGTLSLKEAVQACRR
ncbi:MAG: 1-(5-phosphoribosyl)-5-[(5-phosphoribosylamino)methylideneamino]imidazole-4-carboxamide isomerase [Clostridiales bacterium]|nr:1-(5-phosphoribosyl)-5-[(5-phosphoribosylamino)methylideneamino]imidazole-4-carboxamide isomerase [Clostridiales bacterium]